MKKILLSVGFLISLSLLTGCSSTPKYSNLDKFAQCLTDTGAVIYGTTTCKYCQQQKEVFGVNFSKLNFVDCTKNPMQCNIAKVDAIPHWQIGSNSLQGFQSLEELAKISGCELIPNT